MCIGAGSGALAVLRLIRALRRISTLQLGYFNCMVAELVDGGSLRSAAGALPGLAVGCWRWWNGWLTGRWLHLGPGCWNSGVVAG